MRDQTFHLARILRRYARRCRPKARYLILLTANYLTELEGDRYDFEQRLLRRPGGVHRKGLGWEGATPKPNPVKTQALDDEA